MEIKFKIRVEKDGASYASTMKKQDIIKAGKVVNESLQQERPICSASNRVPWGPVNTLKKALCLWGILISMGYVVWLTPSVAAKQPAPENNTVIVGGNSNYPPYEFIDKNGQPAGFNIDLTRAVAKVMGMNVQIRLGTYEERIRALEAGTIDAMGGFSYSDERARLFDFSPACGSSHNSTQ